MKFSEQWLREWVNPQLGTQDLAETLTMAGLEVDSLEPAAPAFDNVVVGEVLTVEKHPEADKLNITTVNVGQSEPVQIICGASNVKVGIRVPAALIGASLPNGLNIKKAKLRGVESFGMLCSATEIGLAETADGLMILPEDAPVGVSIRDYLKLDDYIIEVDFTPNRGDCLSVAGLSREIGVLTQSDLTPLKIAAVAPETDEVFPVSVIAKEDCPRYLGRVIRNINSKATTPQWMQERLRRAGLRSISPTVDVTNYVLMELGQPLHAFDLDKLDGGIVVRRANKGEKIKLLDESEIEMDSEVLVIADKKQAHAFAGVMGGDESAVGDDTQHIFLECAFFSPDSIRGKARRFGMQTDSSYRFERGVDFNLQKQAMERATRLILDIVGGQAGPVTEVVSEDCFPRREIINVRESRVERVLGIQLEKNLTTSIFQRLGMEPLASDAGWQVKAPSYRFDVAIEADLIEEVGRVYGYNNIPTTFTRGALEITAQPEAHTSFDRIRQVMVDRGYNEAITYSFVDPETQALLDPENKPVVLSNPISADMSVMRTTLWSSLLKTLAFNQARQQNRVRLFEKGMRFQVKNGVIDQETVIAGVAYGMATPLHWSEERKNVDFFDIKADVEAILGLAGVVADYQFTADIHPALHPGQCASINRDGKRVGWMGAIHPSVQRKLDLPNSAYVFELSYDNVCDGRVAKFAPVSKFPSIKRDLALVVEEGVTAQDVCAGVAKAAKSLLQNLDIFDIYRGKGVPEGKKSLAIGLTLQDHAETLTDERVEAVIREVLDILKENTGAVLRE